MLTLTDMEEGGEGGECSVGCHLISGADLEFSIPCYSAKTYLIHTSIFRIGREDKTPYNDFLDCKMILNVYTFTECHKWMEY